MGDVASSDNVSSVIGTFWKDRQRSYDAAGNVEYIGRTIKHKASETTASAAWELWKVSYTGGRITRIEGPLTDGWANRAAADWA